MLNNFPPPVGFFGAVRLCWLLICRPKEFQEAQEKNNEILRELDKGIKRDHPAIVVRRAFFSSLLLVIASGVLGYFIGFLLGSFKVAASPYAIAIQQIVGTLLLLWGTLFIRGWEIQTHGGVTLTERVNQWIYRFLYCVGTAVLVCSVSWPQYAHG